MKKSLIVALVAGTFLLTGCVSPHKYHWADYYKNVYKHEQNELTDQEYMEQLLEGAVEAEQEGKIVPPGYYADLGTAYLKLGDVDSALVYYQKEHDHWPESQPFMATLLKGIQKNKDAFKGNSK